MGLLVSRKILLCFPWELRWPALAVGSYSISQSARGTSQNIIFKTLRQIGCPALYRGCLPALTSVEIGARAHRARRRRLLQRVLCHVPQADVRVLAHRAEPVAGHVLRGRRG